MVNCATLAIGGQNYIVGPRSGILYPKGHIVAAKAYVCHLREMASGSSYCRLFPRRQYHDVTYVIDARKTRPFAVQRLASTNLGP